MAKDSGRAKTILPHFCPWISMVSGLISNFTVGHVDTDDAIIDYT